MHVHACSYHGETVMQANTHNMCAFGMPWWINMTNPKSWGGTKCGKRFALPSKICMGPYGDHTHGLGYHAPYGKKVFAREYEWWGHSCNSRTHVTPMA
jgi:hypothetical protein